MSVRVGGGSVEPITQTDSSQVFFSALHALAESPPQPADSPSNQPMQQHLGVNCLLHLTPHPSPAVHFVEHQTSSTRRPSHSLSHSPLSLVHHSLSTLSHSQARKERKERRRKGRRLKPPAANHHHGDQLELKHHKGWVLEEGEALSSSPFGAWRRRNQEEKRSSSHQGMDPASPSS